MAKYKEFNIANWAAVFMILFTLGITAPEFSWSLQHWIIITHIPMIGGIWAGY